MLITVIYQEKKNRCEREGNLVPEKKKKCMLVSAAWSSPSPPKGARRELSLAGARGALNNSQVSHAQKNYARLTYEGINPVSLLMAKGCVFKCHKKFSIFSLLIVFYNFVRFIKIRFSGGGFFFSFHW